MANVLKNLIYGHFIVQNCLFFRGSPKFRHVKHIKDISTEQYILVKSFMIGSFDELYFNKAKTIECNIGRNHLMTKNYPYP